MYSSVSSVAYPCTMLHCRLSEVSVAGGVTVSCFYAQIHSASDILVLLMHKHIDQIGERIVAELLQSPAHLIADIHTFRAGDLAGHDDAVPFAMTS